MNPVQRITVSAVAVGFLVGACVTSSGTLYTSVIDSPGSPIASAVVGPSVIPSASEMSSSQPSLTTGLASPGAQGSDCGFSAQKGFALPSDRFTDMAVATSEAGDVITFSFGRGSIGSPAGPPRGSLTLAPRPYTYAGSGKRVAMDGEHVLLLRFRHMSLANDVGQETYTGPRAVKADGPAFRQAVMFDESEGVIGWYIGYDGTGCVNLVQDSGAVTVTISLP